MKKYILLTLFTICSVLLSFGYAETGASVSSKKELLTNYRFDPFQWIYPEYFYKAETVPVEKKPQAKRGARIKFFGLSACFPEIYSKDISLEHDIMTMKSESGSHVLIMKASGDAMLCSEEKRIRNRDFCSAYKTAEELFHKLFTLTPETAETTGDKWIVHDKGREFDNVKKILIFSDDSFLAYVKYIKNDLIESAGYSHEINLFHDSVPMNAYINIRLTEKNDIALEQVLSSLE